MPCQSARRMKGKGRRPKEAANADRETLPFIKSGLDQHGNAGYRLNRPSAGQPGEYLRDKDGKRTANQSIVSEPQYRFTPQWTPSFHPPPRGGPAPLLVRENLSITRRIARARNRRSMLVSPTMGKCIEPYTGPLPDTTGHTACGIRRLLLQDHSRK